MHFRGLQAKCMDFSGSISTFPRECPWFFVSFKWNAWIFPGLSACFRENVHVFSWVSSEMHGQTQKGLLLRVLARKPEGVGVRGQGKVAFSHALRREASAVHGFPFPGGKQFDRFQFVEVLGIYVGNWFETCIVWACYDRKPNFFAKMTNILDKMTRWEYI